MCIFYNFQRSSIRYIFSKRVITIYFGYVCVYNTNSFPVSTKCQIFQKRENFISPNVPTANVTLKWIKISVTLDPHMRFGPTKARMRWPWTPSVACFVLRDTSARVACTLWPHLIKTLSYNYLIDHSVAPPIERSWIRQCCTSHVFSSQAGGTGVVIPNEIICRYKISPIS